ncbi:MAG: hypothetical protein AAFX10_12510 [Pseudomonadota bacterium]
MHLYDSNEARIPLGDNRNVKLVVRTRYPWEGTVQIRVDSDGVFALCPRIPAWAGDAWQCAVNGVAVEPSELAKGYLRLDRRWRAGDTVTLEFDMPARLVRAHPLVAENTGRVALRCGPVVYCFEAGDNAGMDTERLLIDENSATLARVTCDIDGAVAIRTSGYLLTLTDWGDAPYRDAVAAIDAVSGPHELTATPYYTWANRAPGSMNVWVRSAPRPSDGGR